MRDALKPLLEQKQPQPPSSANTGLWLDRFIGDQARRPTQKQERGNQGEDRGEDESRGRLVEQVARISPPDEYRLHFRRWRESLGILGAECREATVQGRMSVGLGGEGVLETSITLHRTYGVPYIPGSALKGLAASFAHKHLSEEWMQGGRFHRCLFGDTSLAGYVTFFDALLVAPESGQMPKALHADVLTVHHKEYYEGRKDAPPADWDSPTPVPFLSATGTYLIALASPEGCDEWRNAAFLILEAALTHSGVGAKTSSGYGRLKLEPRKKEAGQDIADDLIKQIEALSLNQVAGVIPQRAQELNKLELAQSQKRRVAEAILAKIKEAKREKAVADKEWFKEMLASLNE